MSDNKWWKTKRNCESIFQIFYIAVVNVGIFVFYTIFYNPVYEEVDDTIMATILYGGYGYYTPYDIFQNIFLTKVLVKLIAWFPKVPWYGLAQVATIFLSLMVITYLVFWKDSRRFRKIVWTVVLFFLWYELYAQMQFTKTAAIASVAGILLVYRICQKEYENIYITLILAFGLCCLGIMWRSSCFGMIFLILFAIGLMDLLKSYKSGFWKKLATYIVGVLCLGVLFLGARYYNDQHYKNNEQMREYIEFNGLRASLLDRGWPEYEKNHELYEELNISEEDIDLYSWWNYADPEIFTHTAISRLCEAKQVSNQDIGQTIKDYFPKIWNNLQQRTLFIIWIWMIVISLLLGAKQNWKYVLYSAIVTIGMEYYFLFIGRGLLNRLDAGILTANIVILGMLAWDEEKEKEMFTALVAATIGVMVFNIPTLTSVYDSEQQENMKTDVALMNGDQQSIYYGEEFTIDEYEKATAGIWERPELGIYSNISRLGGWKYPSPDALGVSTRYGIANPYRQMVDNPNVYLVCNKKELVDKIEAYIKRHYNSNARAIKRKELGEAKVYQIVTKTPRVDVTTAIEDEKVVGSISNISQGENGGLQIKGEIYVPGTNSYNEKIYMRVRNVLTDKTDWFNVTQYCENKAKSITEGQYGGFIKEFENYSLDDIENLEFEMYVQVDGKVYKKTMSKE